ncbi:MmgE/PrpD family protein [Roseomonas sp. AR75]|uniref:MmgE/PrpD family protein n=1 Tax=Roseomonas sp. AR75 TaxID=2562311 RepID=UPI001485161E|nr:MmgE/PrpD family protein [Roseomonas sp. AR75]
MSDGLSRALAARLAETGPAQLPPELLHRVRLFLIDTFGVLGAAARAPGVAEVTALMGGWNPAPGAATALLGGWRGAPDAAALCNGMAAHAMDFDDQHDDARVHAYCVALPAALAAAEARGGLDGATFLTAVALGVELHCRLGLAAHNSLGKGWHPTTALGHLAGAAAAGKALLLDSGGLLSALGIAQAQLGGSAQGLFEQALTKRMGPGFAARSGVLSAVLARAGIAGPKQPLEGRAGLAALHERGEFDADSLLAGWGERWEAMNVSMKPFPCCRCSHSTIQVALALRAEGLRPEMLRAGTIRLSRVNHGAVGCRYDPATAANPVVHAQFSAAYAFAVALATGEAGLESFRAPTLHDPALVALAQRIAVVADDAISPTALAPTIVAIELADGSRIVRARERVLGSPEEPMAEDAIFAKFRGCLADGLGVAPTAADAFAERILHLGAADDAAMLPRAFQAMREASSRH